MNDAQGPEVVSLAASPSSVAPHGAVTITAQVTDATGVESVGFYFLLDGVQRDFCGQQIERTGGTSQDGTWTYECAGPALVQNGEYEVVPYATDVVGNHTNVNCCDTSPTRAHFAVTDEGATDSSAPVVAGLAVSPAEVDVLSGSQVVTVSVQAVDDVAGVQYVIATLRNGEGELVNQIIGSEEPVSGDRGDGVWERQFTIPQGASPGEWTVELELSDYVGHAADYSAAALASAGFDPTISVTHS